jgi:hypothetical protein
VKKKDDNIRKKPLLSTTLYSKENNKTRERELSLEGKNIGRRKPKFEQ